MLKSDVDLLVDNWFLKDKYVFVTYNYFNLDYIVIQRTEEDLFECLPQSTTTILDRLSKDEMVRLIGMDIFRHMPFERWDQDFHDKRRNGCDCGANATTNPDKHAFSCRKYTKP